MELTRGVLLTGISAVGVLACIISWIICAAVFLIRRGKQEKAKKESES